MLQSIPEVKVKIAVLGRENVGKTSFLELVTEKNVMQDAKNSTLSAGVLEITSDLQPVGSVLWMKIPGFKINDNKTVQNQLLNVSKVLDEADVAALVCEGDNIASTEREILSFLQKKRIPTIVIFNKADTHHISNAAGAVSVNSLDKNSRARLLTDLQRELIRVCPEDLLIPPVMFSDLVPTFGTVVMLFPDTYTSIRELTIMPQRKAIRDSLDHQQMILAVRAKEYMHALAALKKNPDLVVCDSQAVRQMVAYTPSTVKCTSFTLLTARMKGSLQQIVGGALALWKLKDGDKVLIIDSFTQQTLPDDMGTVKIPRLISERTGKDLIIDHVFGSGDGINVKNYNLVIHRGLHMHSYKEFLLEMSRCALAGVPITNYSLCLSELDGTLERTLEVFPKTLERYERKREEFLQVK